ncbi:MAG: N-acetyl-gamma-glutamyl-phosphate reductase [Verrucomicrobia bacterium]|nr:N-acetyl-gamma-glutamyl-phosphate reductase [Verrucomicrobiota bacterium]MDA1086944.1 N-acetyl-gamma-glutamyl-phosphate reductase [Verrucomicrobiota bacterium]
MNNPITRVGILGAASYAAGELMKLLYNHPNVEITVLVSETFKDEEVLKHHAFLRDVCGREFDHIPEDLCLDGVMDRCDVIFMSKPHKKFANGYMKQLRSADKKVIDLSGDYRLKNADLYPEYYDFSHEDPELLQKFVYGLPEIRREEIADAQFVANPGCYPTSAVLGLAPALEVGLVKNEGIVIDSISGASGAGKSPRADLMVIDLGDNIRTYGTGTHQHTPEIEQELSSISGSTVQVLFSPHVGGFKTGLSSTLYCPLTRKGITKKEVVDLYRTRYDDEPFVRVYEDRSPEIRDVVGTNFCDIGFIVDSRTNTLVVISTIDNTIKGAGGQAVQNFNLMCGYPEYTALPYEGVIKKRLVTY